jgi:hypothetical protein
MLSFRYKKHRAISILNFEKNTSKSVNIIVVLKVIVNSLTVLLNISACGLWWFKQFWY